MSRRKLVLVRRVTPTVARICDEMSETILESPAVCESILVEAAWAIVVRGGDPAPYRLVYRTWVDRCKAKAKLAAAEKEARRAMSAAKA